MKGSTALHLHHIHRRAIKPVNVSPDNFYDEKMESEKEFEDIASSIILNGGVEKLSVIKDKVSMSELSQPLSSRISSSTAASKAAGTRENAAIPRYLQYLQSKDSKNNSSINSNFASSLLGSSDKSKSVGGKFSNNNSKNYNNRDQPPAPEDNSPMFDDVNESSGPDNAGDKEPNPLQNFISDKDSSKYGSNTQGLRHCPGQRQRRGVQGRLYW
jgi:hypothetical protein